MIYSNPAIIIDTHDIVRKLMATEMSEAQAAAIAEMLIKLIEYQKHQMDQHLQQYREQFGTKGEVQHLEDKVETRFEHLEVQVESKIQPMEGRLNSGLEQLEEGVNDNLNQLEERFNNKVEQLNAKIEQQLMQFTITVGGILVAAVGVIFPIVTYVIGLFK